MWVRNVRPAPPPGEEALGPRVAAALAGTAGLTPVIRLTVEPVPAGASAPGIWRVRVAPVGDAPSRGAGMEVFIGLARKRSLAGGGSIHELDAWQGPLHIAPEGHLGLGMRPAQAGTGPSVLAFIRDPAVHGVTDVVAVPLCRAVPESGDPRTIRP